MATFSERLDKLLDLHSRHVIGFGWKPTTDRFLKAYRQFLEDFPDPVLSDGDVNQTLPS